MPSRVKLSIASDIVKIRLHERKQPEQKTEREKDSQQPPQQDVNPAQVGCSFLQSLAKGAARPCPRGLSSPSSAAPEHHSSWLCQTGGTYLVLSESMVWKSFSSSSSLSVPSEKKAWNSSRDSFPSSAKSNTAGVRAKRGQSNQKTRSWVPKVWTKTPSVAAGPALQVMRATPVGSGGSPGQAALLLGADTLTISN